MAETGRPSKKKPLSKAAQKYEPKHTLLSLPPEIRNVIWEYVVSPYEACEYKQPFQLMFYACNNLVFPLDNTETSQTKLLGFLLRMNPEVRLLAQEDATWRIWNESDDFDESYNSVASGKPNRNLLPADRISWVV
ncbi:hypothetical protein AC579_1786 [Pseudocercospora musae]|uniref:Uncharacterized protein n=1 Tax=Pseudocercospora musae TaxID=113226 RepID=A0A139IPJ2_9PEZI|nr:hypothetical protein AC579_1786 [Pseudocercospora musae]